MNRSETVRQMWDEFAAAVLPPEVSAVQRRETRRAFYAAFFALLSALREIGGEDVGEEEGAARLEAWTSEVEVFHADVKAGRA